MAEINPINVRQVETIFELIEALKLVHDKYVENKYMIEEPHGIRLCLHNALPNTKTFIAESENGIISTLSLFFDSPEFGLPMDALFRDRLNIFRNQKRRLAEVGMLADRRQSVLRALPVVLRLMKKAYWSSKENLPPIDDVVITVHPDHGRFYNRILRFERFGETKDYSAVCGNPALPMRLNISGMNPEKDFPSQIYELFYTRNNIGIHHRPYHLDKQGFDYLFRELTGFADNPENIPRNKLELIEKLLDSNNSMLHYVKTAT